MAIRKKKLISRPDLDIKRFDVQKGIVCLFITLPSFLSRDAVLSTGFSAAKPLLVI